MSWIWMVVMAVQPCEYTKNHQVAHFKSGNIMMNYISTERAFEY